MKTSTHPFKKGPFSRLFEIFISTSIFLVLLSNSEAIKRASYGESCDMTTFCRSKELISCREGICACVKPDAMVYDAENKSCVTLVGERCSYTVVSTLDNSESDEFEAEKIVKSYRQDLSCVRNSKCNAQGLCACKDNFYEVSNGTCAPKGNFGDTCSSAGECREDLLLTCNLTKGKCDCSDKTMYDNDSKRCVGRAGESCVSGRCVKNSECDLESSIRTDYYGDYYDGKSYSKRNPNYNVCQCRSGFQKSDQGLCYAPYGGRCDTSPPQCTPGLTCRAQICSCPYPSHQEYHSAQKKCITKIGGPCVSAGNTNISNIPFQPSPSTSCVPHASCIAEENDTPKCTCNTGFSENSNRECDLAYGSPCPHPTGLECDRKGGLVCMENSHCGCPDELQTYDPILKTCRGLVGSTCSTKKDDGFCIEGSNCVPLRASESGVGICKCLAGYTILPENRICQEGQIISDDDTGAEEAAKAAIRATFDQNGDETDDPL